MSLNDHGIIIHRANGTFVVAADSGRSMWVCGLCCAHGPIAGMRTSNAKDRQNWITATLAKADGHICKI